MGRFEDLKHGASVKGVLPDGLVTGVDVKWHGTEAVELTYKDTAGREGQELLYRDRGARGNPREAPLVDAVVAESVAFLTGVVAHPGD